MQVKSFLQLAKSLKKELVAIRRHIHQYPELSFEEIQTTQFIENKLIEWGLKDNKKPLKTGIVGTLTGCKKSKNIVALRADIDALPLEEKTELSYASKNIGIMHACGHDVHTTCLLGALKILSFFQKDFSGKVRYIFQPGEEKNPGGASLLLKTNIFKKDTPQSIFALHVDNTIEVGQIGYLDGNCMASADELYITLKGEGGHAASPHLQADTILAASHLIIQLQNIVSRHTNPFNPSVLSICSIHGGNATNVIPQEVKLKGTFRAMDETWRKEAHQLIIDYCKNVSQTFKIKIQVKIDKGYPVLFNDKKLTQQATLWLEGLIGKKNIIESFIRMSAEDFGYYTHVFKGTFLRLGIKPKDKQKVFGVHHPKFDIDEDALIYGAATLAWLAFQHNSKK